MEYKKEIEELISTVVGENASDLHLSIGRNPIIRVSGNLLPIVKKPIITENTMKGYLNEFLTEKTRIEFERDREVDFAYSTSDVRFRGNAYYRQNGISIALRLIPKVIR